jgi:phosphotriesterase-related protein
MKMPSRRDFLRIAGQLTAAAASSQLVGCFDDSVAGTDPNRPATPDPIPSPAGGKNVRTVRGPMDPTHLGITDMHEHVLRDREITPEQAATMFDAETLEKLAELSSPPPVPKSFFPDEPDHPILLRNRHYLTRFYANAQNNFVLGKDLMLGELKTFAALGGKSILDCSPTYERGTPSVVRQMSEETGINVILSTGINSHTMLPIRFKNMTVGQLAEYFEREINVGIEDSDVKAGHIKLLAEAAEYGVPATADQSLLRGLEAAAAVSRNTGAPVTLHAFNLMEDFKPLLEKVAAFGMPKDRMILSHFSTNLGPMDLKTMVREPQKLAPNLEAGLWAMDRGFVLSFDLFGAGMTWFDSHRGHVPEYDPRAMAAIFQYVKAGLGDKIVLGTDLWMRTQTREHGGPGIALLLNEVVPQLLDVGLSQDEVDQILIRTPARLLAF